MKLISSLSLIAIFFCLVSCDQVNSLIGSSTEQETDDSVVKKFYEDGTLKSSYEVNELQQKHGVAKNYSATGKLKQSFVYENGEKIKATSYYKNGSPLMEIDYKNGVKDGFIKRYYDTGQLESETPFKEDYAGSGLKEYTKSGELKTVYPNLIVKPIDQIKSTGKYIVEVYFDKNPGRGTYYIGSLTEDKYLNYKIDELPRSNYHGRFTVTPAPHAMIMEKLTFVGVYKTPTGNKHIVQKHFNLAIDNTLF